METNTVQTTEETNNEKIIRAASALAWDKWKAYISEWAYPEDTCKDALKHFSLLKGDVQEAQRYADTRSRELSRWAFKNPTIPGSQEQADKAFLAAATGAALLAIIAKVTHRLTVCILRGQGGMTFDPTRFRGVETERLVHMAGGLPVIQVEGGLA